MWFIRGCVLTCRYSFIVVMMDRVFLINSWPFLVKHFRKLIDDLQAKVRKGCVLVAMVTMLLQADAVYSSDSEESKSARSLRGSLSSLPGPGIYRTRVTGFLS